MVHRRRLLKFLQQCKERGEYEQESWGDFEAWGRYAEFQEEIEEDAAYYKEHVERGD